MELGLLMNVELVLWLMAALLLEFVAVIMLGSLFDLLEVEVTLSTKVSL